MSSSNDANGELIREVISIQDAFGFFLPSNIQELEKRYGISNSDVRHCIKNVYPHKDESSLFQAEEPSDSDDESENTLVTQLSIESLKDVK